MIRLGGEFINLSGDNSKDIKAISDDIYNLKEDLQYYLSHLDNSNMTDTYNKELKDGFGNFSLIQQEAERISTRISNLNGDMSSLTQTVNGVSAEISAVDGRVTTLDYTVDNLTVKFKDKDGNQSSFSLKDGSLDLQNLVFAVLGTNGATIINGGNITTGSINADLITTGSLNADRISGGTISSSVFRTTTQSVGGNQYCSLQITDGALALYQRGDFGTRTGYFSYNQLGVTEFGSDGGSQLWISSDNILKLSSGRNMSIQAGHEYTIYIGSGVDEKNDIIIGNNISTGGRRKVYLWGDVYINGVLQ